MIDKLKNFILNYPEEHNYSKIIKSQDSELLVWIDSQLPEVLDINEKIYLLLNPRPICSNGNNFTFNSFKKGYKYCGPASSCQCLMSKSKDTDKNKQRIEKIKNTKTIKYGDATYNNRELYKNTLNKNYGVSNPMYSSKIRENFLNSLLEKYGVTNIMKNNEVKERNKLSNIENNINFHTRSHLSQSVIEKLDNIEWLKSQNETKTPLAISKELGTSSSVIYKIFNKHNIEYRHHYNTSVWQNEIETYISSITTCEILKNDRTILNGQELDIVIPELNLAFECNGILWHSEVMGGKDSKYHLNKTKLAENAGYKLIHLHDNEWHTKSEIIKSRISNELKLNNRIYGRNTLIRKLSTVEEKEFFNKTHLQGYTKSAICYGLTLDNNIVAAMSFGKSRFNKNFSYELLRYSTDLYQNIVGGPSKLLLKFVKDFDPENIVSYSHRTFGTSSLYKKLDFEFSHSSLPSYRYTKNYHILENRLKYQKSKIKDLLPVFDAKLSEWENMKANGFDRIWDCGNDVWAWTKTL